MQSNFFIKIYKLAPYSNFISFGEQADEFYWGLDLIPIPTTNPHFYLKFHINKWVFFNSSISAWNSFGII